MELLEKVVVLHDHFTRAEIPHAFGGALALAYCTIEARGTQDIDLNLFVAETQREAVLRALPIDVVVSDTARAAFVRDGQTRVAWDYTPVDLFLATTEFHEAAATRIRWEDVRGVSIPFLDCSDLAVFKAYFNRTKDWADLEAMAEAGTIAYLRVRATLAEYLGADDERVAHLDSLYEA